MTRLNRVSAWLTAGLLVAVAGCGASNQVSIQGQVTLDGQTVDPGSIVFLPEGGSGAKVAAPIQEGKYQIGVDRGASPGNFRVEINWSRPTGRQVPSADPGIMMDETREAIPPQYNAQSTLVREIKPGENVHDFELQSR